MRHICQIHKEKNRVKKHTFKNILKKDCSNQRPNQQRDIKKRTKTTKKIIDPSELDSDCDDIQFKEIRQETQQNQKNQLAEVDFSFHRYSRKNKGHDGKVRVSRCFGVKKYLMN